MTNKNSVKADGSNPKQPAPKADGLRVRTAIKAGLNYTKICF